MSISLPRNRRRLLRVAVAILAVAGAAAATLPFALVGGRVAVAVRDLPLLVAASGVPARLDVVTYERGLYRSRFVSELRFGGAAGREIEVESVVEHRLLGARIVSTVRDPDWVARLPGRLTGADAPGPELVTEIELTPFARGASNARAVLGVPALVVHHEDSGAEWRLAASRTHVGADASGFALSLDVDSIATRGAASGSSTWSGTRVRAAVEDEPASAAGVFSGSLTVDAARIRAGGLVLELDALALEGRFVPGDGKIAPSIVLGARTVESKGIPYVRLDGLRTTLDATVTGSPGVVAASRVVLDAAFAAGSNHGPIEGEGQVEWIPPAAGPEAAAGAATDASISVRGPASLARLLLSPYPELAEDWRRRGILVEAGARATLAAHWSERGVEPVPAR